MNHTAHTPVPTSTYRLSYYRAHSEHTPDEYTDAALPTIDVEASSAEHALRIGQVIATTRENAPCIVAECTRITPASQRRTRREAATAVALAFAIAALIAIVMPTLEQRDELADTARAVAALGAAAEEEPTR